MYGMVKHLENECGREGDGKLLATPLLKAMRDYYTSAARRLLKCHTQTEAPAMLIGVPIRRANFSCQKLPANAVALR